MPDKTFFNLLTVPLNQLQNAIFKYMKLKICGRHTSLFESILLLCWNLEENLQIMFACLMNLIHCSPNTRSGVGTVKNGRDFHCCVCVCSRAPLSTLTTVHELVSSPYAFMSYKGSVAIGRVHSLYHAQSCPPYLFIYESYMRTETAFQIYSISYTYSLGWCS